MDAVSNREESPDQASAVILSVCPLNNFRSFNFSAVRLVTFISCTVITLLEHNHS